jgi:predicted SnoaL-like aldol condensation-catalyzing enzyme
MADLERNKRTVVLFYTRAFTDHEPADAVAQYVGQEYIQHNPETPDGMF